MNSKSTWPAVVLASVGAIVGAVMAIMKVSPDTIALVASLMVVPVITALLAGQVSELKGTTNQLTTQTNGNWSKVLELLAQSPAINPNTTAPPPTVEATQHGTEGS